MERQIPKNVRQIGNVSDSPKVYVEDYVDTFFLQLCEKTKEGPVGAFLVGDMQKTDDEEYVYIYGAIQMHDLKMADDQFVIDDETWKKGYEDCKQFFEDAEMLGWFVAREGSQVVPDAQLVKLHKKSFPKKNTIFITKEALEKDEVYYAQKFNDLMEMGGHYTYYEKNPAMQNYMIASRKKNGVSPSETVEDRAAKDFRTIVKDRSERRKKRKVGPLTFAASLCFVLAVALLLATTWNNANKMNSVQNALDEIAEKEQKDANSIEANVELPKESKLDDEETPLPEPPKSNVVAAEGKEPDGKPKENESLEEKPEEKPEGKNLDGQIKESSDKKGNGSNGVYIVEEGDTLVQISKKIYDDLEHVEVICKVNGLSDGNLIYVGQKLVLP